MRDFKRDVLPGPLRLGAVRLQCWRRARERGTRIPQRLWTLAVRLAGEYGVSRTAAALKLDYYSLQRRLDETTLATNSAATSTAALAAAGRPAFLDVTAPALAAAGECVIECENGDGAKMRIHLKGVALSDLATLSRSLWRAE